MSGGLCVHRRGPGTGFSYQRLQRISLVTGGDGGGGVGLHAWSWAGWLCCSGHETGAGLAAPTKGIPGELFFQHPEMLAAPRGSFETLPSAPFEASPGWVGGLAASACLALLLRVPSGFLALPLPVGGCLGYLGPPLVLPPQFFVGFLLQRLTVLLSPLAGGVVSLPQRFPRIRCQPLPSVAGRTCLDVSPHRRDLGAPKALLRYRGRGCVSAPQLPFVGASLGPPGLPSPHPHLPWPLWVASVGGGASCIRTMA